MELAREFSWFAADEEFQWNRATKIKTLIVLIEFVSM